MIGIICFSLHVIESTVVFVPGHLKDITSLVFGCGNAVYPKSPFYQAVQFIKYETIFLGQNSVWSESAFTDPVPALIIFNGCVIIISRMLGFVPAIPDLPVELIITF